MSPNHPLRYAALPVVGILALFLVSGLAGAFAPPASASSTSAGISFAISLKNLTVGKDPTEVAYSPISKMVYVVNTGSNTTSAIKGTGAPVTIAVGVDPQAVIFSPSTRDMIVLNYGSHSVSVINASNKVAKTITLPGLYPRGLTYDPANGNTYTLSYVGANDEIIDVNHTTGATRGIVIPSGAQQVVYDNATTDLVISDAPTNQLTFVTPRDAGSNLTLTTGLSPNWMTYDPNAREMFISDLGESGTSVTKTGNVTILSPTNTIAATLKVGRFPLLSVYDPANHDVYVDSDGVAAKGIYPNGTVTVISGANKVLHTLAVGRFAVIPSYNPANQMVYVPCAQSNTTYVINSTTNTVTAKLTTKGYPSIGFADPANREFFIVGASNSQNSSSHGPTIVTVVPRSNTGLSSLSLAGGPAGGGAYDPSDGDVYVSNEGAGTVTVLL